MNIQRAAMLAKEIGEGMYRHDRFPYVIIIPTNTAELCMVSSGNKDSGICPRWQPSLEDLIADDWKVPGSATV
jgi:hypothetical protein